MEDQKITIQFKTSPRCLHYFAKTHRLERARGRLQEKTQVYIRTKTDKEKESRMMGKENIEQSYIYKKNDGFSWKETVKRCEYKKRES